MERIRIESIRGIERVRSLGDKARDQILLEKPN